MKLLQRRTQPKTPLTHTSEFTTEEIVAFFFDEYGVDLSGDDEEMILCYVDLALHDGAEQVVRTHQATLRNAEYLRNRSPQMVFHDSYAVEEHQMNLRMKSQEAQA